MDFFNGGCARATLFALPIFFGSQMLEAGRPNVLFIAVDDLKPELGCYGNTIIKTPNIDKLAERATVFKSAYCQQAVCAPSRVSLLTGLRPDNTQVWDLQTQMRDILPDVVTLPQLFKENGYVSVGIGKVFDFRSVDWRMDSVSWSRPYYRVTRDYYYNQTPPILYWYQDPETRRIAEKYLEEAAGLGLTSHPANQYALQFIKPSVEMVDGPDHVYTDGAMTYMSLDILSNLAENKQPFFFAVGYSLPHLPFNSPKKYWDLYERDSMPLAEFQEHAKNSPEIAYHASHELRSYTDIPPLASFSDQTRNIGLPEYKQKELIHGYYAAVSYIDAQIGKLIDHLEALGLAENTIVIIWGDHGWHLGDHDLWCKHTNFEQSARAPLIIAAPRQSPSKTKSIVEFIDIYPTLAELAGINLPEGLDGMSLVPVINDPEHELKPFAISQFPRSANIMGYSLRTNRYRLTWWIENGWTTKQPFDESLVFARELYDYKKDPLETENLIGKRRYRRAEQKLNSLMTGFFQLSY